MKKIALLIVALLLIPTIVLTVAACDQYGNLLPQPGQEKTLDFARVYALAEERGYEGTMEELIAAFKGDSAYQIAHAAGYEGDEDEWLESLRGADGATPEIGENGHWYIGDVDTGVVAKGQDGAPGNSIVSIEKIDTEGLVDTYEITFTEGEPVRFTVTNGRNGENGSNGIAPSIGEDGHWYIGDVDTGVVAKGENGTNGTNGSNGITPTIGENGHWYIGDEDTGVAARGANGAAGVGIDKVEKKTNDLVDTYTFTLSNGETFDITVTNGKDAEIPAVDPDAPTADEYFRFTLLSDDTYEVKARYHDMPSRTIIPSTYNGKAVTTIAAYGFEGRDTMDEVVIPASVKEVKGYAFKSCDGLKTVTVEADSKITYVGQHVFKGCTSLETATIQSTLCHSVAETPVKTVVVNTGTKILSGAFSGCSTLTSVSFSDTLTDIYSEAFKDCSALTSVTLPEGLKQIWKNAFEGCRALREITIPNSVIAVQQEAFKSCTALRRVTLSNKMTLIPSRMFDSCYSLSTVTIPESVTTISNYAFISCRNLYRIVIPSTLGSIGAEAFRDCYRLVEVENRSSLAITAAGVGFGRIGYYAENVCTGPQGSRVTEMENGLVVYVFSAERNCVVAYNGDESDITIPNGIIELHPYAFYKNEILRSVKLPSTLKVIGANSFYDCNNLMSVNIPAGIESIGEKAFKESEKLWYVWNESSLELTLGSTNDGYVAYYADTISDKELYWLGDSAYNVSDDLSSVIYLRYAGRDTEVAIVYNTSTIAKDAFKGCSFLVTVKVPYTVTRIEEGAFTGCTYAHMTIIYDGTQAGWDANVEIVNGGGIGDNVHIFYSRK